MGVWFSQLLNIFGDREARILVLGLDNAGASLLLPCYAASTGIRGDMNSQTVDNVLVAVFFVLRLSRIHCCVVDYVVILAVLAHVLLMSTLRNRCN
jgi:hypothetical protein